MGIIVYSTPTCNFCNALKRFLQGNHIPFEDRDVIADSKAKKEMMAKSGQTGTPVTEIDGEIIVGFDEKKLIIALENKKYISTRTTDILPKRTLG